MTRLAERRNRSAMLIGTLVFVFAAMAYAALGAAVSHVPPAGVDAAARAMTGEAPGAAWIFTESCLWPVLTAFGLAGCAVAFRFRRWRARIAFGIVTTLVCWMTSDQLKNVFARPRPQYWIVHHETTYSYSSGHAMFATIVYWLWAYFIARSGLPIAVRTPLCVLLGGWGAAVIWSRLALGAHYPSDLVGGVLLGIAMVALLRTIARVLAPNAGIFRSNVTARNLVIETRRKR